LKASHILVFGAGAIGLWLTGKLAKAGYKVTAITRLDHYETILAKGLSLSEHGSRETIRNFKVYSDLSLVPEKELNDIDWIFLTVKTYDVPKALEILKSKIKIPYALVSFQNGLGSEELIIPEVKTEKLYFASVTKAVAVIEPGKLMISDNKGGIGIAAYLKNQPELQSLAQMLQTSGFQVKIFQNFREMRWSKLLLNIVGNASSAILDYSTEDIFKRKPLFALELEALREAVKVMTKLKIRWLELPGISLPPFKDALIFLPPAVLYPFWSKKMSKARGEKSPSLRLEMNKGKNKSEVEYLNGAVARRGEKIGIKTQANQFLYQTLTQIINGKLNHELYRHNPEQLIKAYLNFKKR
jgi:2-dehydropantoate 2-reductase